MHIPHIINEVSMILSTSL